MIGERGLISDRTDKQQNTETDMKLILASDERSNGTQARKMATLGVFLRAYARMRVQERVPVWACPSREIRLVIGDATLAICR